MNCQNLCLWLLMAAIAAQAGPSNQPAAGPVAAKVDQLFAEWNRTDSPGCNLAVSRNGVVIYEHGYGMANLELGIAITPASVMPAASISKQFTAMCTLLLAQRGQLSLDDHVEKFIPEWAYREQPITIRHLLTHTSGLRDAFTLLGLAAPREDDVSVNDAIPKALARQRGLNFAPSS
jgi:CubicO group peptidase (beta-lactamase class C family)